MMASIVAALYVRMGFGFVLVKSRKHAHAATARWFVVGVEGIHALFMIVVQNRLL